MSASRHGGQQRRTRRLRSAWLVAVMSVAVGGAPLAVAHASVDGAGGSGGAAGASWQILEPANTGIPGNYVYSVAVDSSDRPWVTGDDPVWNEGGLGELTGSTWRQWTNVDAKAPTHDPGNLIFDASGQAWMASRVGLLTLEGGKVRKVWSKKNAPWPTNLVRDFDWDSHGNLWVAMAAVKTVSGGVARYDGSSWKVWTTANGLPWDPPWDQVSALEIDDQDRVWIGSPVMGGAVFNGTKWKALGNGSGYWVTDITIAPDGTPWYAFIGTGVMTWSGTRWVDRTGPFGTDSASLVTTDRDGRVWIGTYIGRIWRWSGSGSSWDLSYDVPSLSHIYGLAFDSRNQPHVGGIGGLDIRHRDGTWSVYTSQNTALPSRWVDHIMIDSAGRGWFSTAGGGIGVYDGRRWTDFNPANWGSVPWPFDTDSSTSTVEAADGTVWAAPTNHGVGEWDGKKWTAHLPGFSYESLTIDPAGDVWAAPDRGEVRRWNGSKWIGMKNPSRTADLYQIAADASGDVWLASIIGLLRYDGTKWKTYTPANSGIPSGAVFTVAPEPDGDAVWVGTDSGLARFDGTNWTVFTEEDSGLPADVISSIAIAPDGNVWIGAFDGENWPYHGGVGVFDGETWTSYTTSNSPLPHNQVETVAVDAQGRVWIGTASEGAAILTP